MLPVVPKPLTSQNVQLGQLALLVEPSR